MKKYITLLLILVILISGIFFVKEYIHNDTHSTSDSAGLQVLSDGQDALDSTAPVEEDIAFCELPAVFDCSQELISALRAGVCETRNGTYSLQSIKQKIDSVYIPAAIPDGFVLYGIDLTEHAITYLYVQEEYAEKSIFSSANGIVVDFSLYTMADPLSGIAEQYDIPINEEGYIYSPEDNMIVFAPGNTWMAITVPDSMNNYDTLKSLCVVERVSIHAEAE